MDNNIIFTEDQKKALDNIKKYYDSRGLFNYAVLSGQAGTGKTFLTKYIVDEIFKQKVTGVAVAHEAKNILKKSIGDNSEVYTYAKIMGKTPEINEITGEIKFIKSDDPILKTDIYIVDECSMWDQNMIEEFESTVRNYRFSSFILYIGDHHQLPPIISNNNDSQLNFSPLFERDNVFYLNEIVRTNKDNNIRKLSVEIAKEIDNENNLNELLNKISDISFYNTDKAEGTVITNNRNNIIKTYVDTYNNFTENGDINKCAIISYKNSSCLNFNLEIRNRLGFTEEYEVGDIITMKGNYINKKKDIYLTNRERFWVKNVKKKLNKGLKCWNLTIVRFSNNDEEESYNIPVLTQESLSEYFLKKNELLSKLKKAKGRSYYAEKSKYLNYVTSFAWVNYGHTLTTYTAQGSTIETVFADIQDILSTNPLNDLRKLQSIYVAVTRASKRLVLY